MKNKTVWVLGIILIAIIVLVIVLVFTQCSPDYFINNTFNGIGGQRDFHGCLGPAGYSWNATEMECVREWLLGVERYQISDFQHCADAGYPIMESYPRQCNTPSGRHFVENLTS